MEKSKKNYMKAMNYYYEGNFEKALIYCEKSLELGRGNSAALNLKGLLLYLKGDLEEARNQWKINYRLNNDDVARKYLEDSNKDKENLKLFNEGKAAFAQLKIKEALELFKNCEKSHFNFINLNNYLAQCYIKLGQYNNAEKHINEVLKTDKNNKMATETVKLMNDLGVIKYKKKYSNKILVGSSITLILLISLSIYTFIKVSYNKNNLIVEDNNKKNNDQKQELSVKEEKEEEINKNKVEENKKEENKFPFEELKVHIDNSKYDDIIKILKGYKNSVLNDNEKQMYIKASNFINKEAIKVYYDKAEEFRNKGDYKNSIKELEKIYEFSEGNYLYEHIIYMLALSYEKESDITTSIKYYEIYANKFKDGDYIENVIYNLAVLNENTNIEKSKKYANEIINKFPYSQFNNSKIENILR
ncbi:tetratricopeptide repeat family protein [Clostridium argentinense CDC 2741]|uniref:Tetratricopeptide repeat family protein n=2 Tax=Clostridium argentinense TaxID=29341 RepID=A0A0C1TZ89_9CLOT|nr:tetratricopeptide repeat protein [Clostridium argentinense]KIE44573.1 tetratricopeptide repeat family protein [Clostridium argentinense CDC 2741]ARC83738.1 hypothetical protein RSJ17_03950 [Clostridium argentinense]NFF39640.1 tetratricopeptide repeat protein [Clostridium argentinense]NFP49641.1 tetratricopeptide repeat protein [Clostridium argentinense]NFP72042.1 tetratricopeptide repeat protein [Clostridium argentinense]